jgi:hypothetical protein
VTINFSNNILHHGVSEWVSKRVYPKVSGLADWSDNCKWYSSLPLPFDRRNGKMCTKLTQFWSSVKIIWILLTNESN